MAPCVGDFVSPLMYRQAYGSSSLSLGCSFSPCYIVKEAWSPSMPLGIELQQRSPSKDLLEIRHRAGEEWQLAIGQKTLHARQERVVKEQEYQDKYQDKHNFKGSYAFKGKTPSPKKTFPSRESSSVIISAWFSYELRLH